MRRIVPVAFCLAIALVTAHAQSNYAVVRGSILDPQHRPVAGARVYITAKGTGAEREVVSNATGLYEIAGLQGTIDVLIAVVGGEHYEARVWCLHADALDDLDSVQAREPQVHQGYIGLVLAELRNRLHAVRGLADDLKAIGYIEQCHQPLSHHVVVFDNQQANRYVAQRHCGTIAHGRPVCIRMSFSCITVSWKGRESATAKWLRCDSIQSRR